MIVNYTEAGWEVITQRAHGVLAAQFAGQWKWAKPPVRPTELLLAIAEHDDAENELDGETLLTPTGGPLNFDMKNFELAHCQKLASLTLTKSRYIALLTSMHMVFLYSKEETENPEAKKFLAGQRRLQTEWRHELQLSKDEADTAYALLEWCDALSLLLCQGSLPPEKRRAEISTGPDGKLYSLVQLDDDSLTVEPWPFAAAVFPVRFETRLIPQISFPSGEVFRQAFLEAPAKEKVWTMRKARVAQTKGKKKR